MRALGEQKAGEVFAETMTEIDRTSLDTPEDASRFALALHKRGGLLSAVGKALQAKALQIGAARPAPE